MIFEKEFTVEESQVDSRGRLKLSSLLLIFQELAGEQCSRRGLGWQSLWDRGLFWAVTRNRGTLQRLPRLGEKVRMRTWPMPQTRTAYPRAMELTDGQGDLLVQVMSLWVLMDHEKRTMVLPGRSGVEVPGITLGTELPAPGSMAPVQGEILETRTVQPVDLDHNGHMNNTRYLDWAAEFFGQALAEHPPKSFQIGYLSEALAGEELGLKAVWEPGRLLLEGVRDGAPNRVFSLELDI